MHTGNAVLSSLIVGRVSYTRLFGYSIKSVVIYIVGIIPQPYMIYFFLPSMIQLVVAPSLPDGSGPDWSRVVLTVNQPSCPNPAQTSHLDSDNMEYASESFPCRESGVLSDTISSDALNGSVQGQQRLNPEIVSGNRKMSSSLTQSPSEHANLSEDLDWDSDEPAAVASAEADLRPPTPPPPPKPPLPLVLRQGKRPCEL